VGIETKNRVTFGLLETHYQNELEKITEEKEKGADKKSVASESTSPSEGALSRSLDENGIEQIKVALEAWEEKSGYKPPSVGAALQNSSVLQRAMEQRRQVITGEESGSDNGEESDNEFDSDSDDDDLSSTKYSSNNQKNSKL